MSPPASIWLDAYRPSLQVHELGGATVVLAPEAPASPMLNRIMGLGTGGPATEQQLDDALAAVPAGTTFYVAVETGAEPAELPRWLERRGLEPGWGWMRFRRGSEPLPFPDSTLAVVEVESAEAAVAFARVVRAGYGLPEPIEPALAAAMGSGWRSWLALDDEEPVAAAGLFVDGETGYLGFAATLAEHRGRGGQSLLLAERIRRAGELGCRTLVTETGERRDDRPSGSYRNLLRAGFEEVAVVAHWVGTR